MMLSADVRSILQTNGIWLNKELGQHFLIDASVLDAIVAAADIRSGEHIVEIGPGIGVLTKRLLKAGAQVTAIEFDEKLIPLLKQYVTKNQKPETNNLMVTQGNALKVPMPETPYKIVANIPYHITSPLLRHVFLESTMKPSSLTLLIQREVAERICDTHDSSILSIIVGLFGSPHIVAIVPPEAFLPPPKVDSAILQIESFAQPKAEPAIMDQIFRLTKHAFSQKRKMLSNSIENLPGGARALEIATIDPKRRPQSLTIDEWIALAHAFDA